MSFVTRTNLKGPTGTIDTATAHELPTGAAPTVALAGTPSHRDMAFGIPRANSVESSTIVADDHLWMTLTDGTMLDAGVARGAQGLPGTGAVPADSAVAGYVATTGTSATRSALEANFARGVSVTDSRFGAVGDGVVDDTAAIQSAVDFMATLGGGTVFVPSGTYMIRGNVPSTTTINYLHDEGGVALRDNIHLLLDKGAVLQAFPTSQDQYVVVRVYDKSNITVEGGTIRGERADHTGTTGEWGYGIAVSGGTGITIRDVLLDSFWGDGINIQKLSEFDVPTDVRIENVRCRGNRRQGMSIEGGIDITVVGSTFSDTSGTAPMCGVDVEPFSNLTPVRNITFRDCRFENNGGSGLLLMQDGLRNITVENCIFSGNLSTEAQLTTISTSGAGFTVRGCAFSSSPGGAVLMQGGSDYLLEGNTSDAGMFVRKGRDNSAIGNVVIRNNSLRGTIRRLEWISVESYAREVMVEGNFIDATGTTYSVNDAGIRVDSASIVSAIRNRVIGVPTAVVVSSSVLTASGIVVEGNDFDNTGRGAVALSAIASVRVLGNTIAGACLTESAQGAMKITGTCSEIDIRNNTIRQAPRISTALTGRIAVGVTWPSSGVSALRTSGNKLVAESGALKLHDDGAPTPASSYLGGESGVMARPTTYRPTTPPEGSMVLDTTLNKPIWFRATAWRDSAGTTV